MRFLAIHYDGYLGEGIVSPSFEIEAADPQSRVEAVYPIAGVSQIVIRDARHLLQTDPDITAHVIATITGSGNVGMLARKDDDMVVFRSSTGDLDEDDEFLWQSLNPDSYWTGEPDGTEFTRPDFEPIAAGEMTHDQVLENYVVN
ncbi:hypothetical protein [Tessaracoccus sp. Y1736]